MNLWQPVDNLQNNIGVPLYPIELLGTPEIHPFIPHLPISKSKINGEECFSIPFGDFGQTFPKIGILVTEVGRTIYRLDLMESGDAPLPDSVEYSRKLSAPIGIFTVDMAQKVNNRVNAFSKDGESIELKKRHIFILGNPLTSAIDRAKNRNNVYNSSYSD